MSILQQSSSARLDVAAMHQNRAFLVLIVDDNEADRQLTTIRLGQAWSFEHDLTVDYAADGPEALAKLQAKRYAAVLLDWGLPGMSGGEVLRELRRRGSHTPVIIVSGLPQDQIADEITSLGAAFLCKEDMTPSSLRTVIAGTLWRLGFGRPPSAPLPDPPGSTTD